MGLGELGLRSTEETEYVFVVHVVEFQYLFGSVIYLIVQDGEEQVLFVYALCVLYASLEYGELQDVRCPFVEHQLTGVDGLHECVFAHFGLQGGLHRRQVQSQTVEHVDDRTFLHAQQSQEQVLGPHGRRRQSRCLLT